MGDQQQFLERYLGLEPYLGFIWISFLDAPVGSAFERVDGTEFFWGVHDFQPPAE